jgi:hypothetical protein
MSPSFEVDSQISANSSEILFTNSASHVLAIGSEVRLDVPSNDMTLALAVK